MLSLPDRHLDADDREQLADWIEASALLAPAGEVSQGEVFDVLADSGLFEVPRRLRRAKRGATDDETAQDQVRLCVEDVWRVLRERKRRLASAYPFDVDHGGVRRAVASLQGARCYALLLFADLGKSYRRVQVDYDAGSPFCRLFEKVVEACERRIFGGVVVRFGHPHDADFPKAIQQRVKHLADRFERPIEKLEGKVHERDKDLGLDVAARVAIGDEEPGTLMVMTQCATGGGWKKKKEPSLREWDGLVQWKAHAVRAIAFPWRMRANDFLWRDAKRLEAILLDRMRLLSAGNPDPRLDGGVAAELDAWCAARALEFPALT
jgi:hypothetical protein